MPSFQWIRSTVVLFDFCHKDVPVPLGGYLLCGTRVLDSQFYGLKKTFGEGREIPSFETWNKKSAIGGMGGGDWEEKVKSDLWSTSCVIAIKE